MELDHLSRWDLLKVRRATEGRKGDEASHKQHLAARDTATWACVTDEAIRASCVERRCVGVTSQHVNTDAEKTRPFVPSSLEVGCRRWGTECTSVMQRAKVQANLSVLSVPKK